jgi:hypothetical protein
MSHIVTKFTKTDIRRPRNPQKFPQTAVPIYVKPKQKGDPLRVSFLPYLDLLWNYLVAGFGAVCVAPGVVRGAELRRGVGPAGGGAATPDCAL